MEKEATEAAAQAKDSELLGRLKITFGQNTSAGALFDTLRDRLSLTWAVQVLIQSLRAVFRQVQIAVLGNFFVHFVYLILL